ncbi:gamma carbonic anhydrase family protein [Facilibium subflavum]|uniref:gamma carbonic anhydrase family protein n=1 Tax=Facilibium subflavum TaxID=2219058 RepID=UPI000E65AE09|nr:gamma carbonic anhydrase family protein [Facilibium subflavum]
MPVRTFNEIHPKIAKSAFVDSMATVTGKVVLSEHVSIWPNVSIRGDLLSISIGKNSNVQDNTVIHTTEFFDQPGQGYDVVIGEDVTVGHGAIIHGCHIGNRVLVGMGAIVLDGVVVEDDVIIGAGTVVPPGKRLETGYLYLGSPAKCARKITEQEKAHIINNAQNYIQTKNKHAQDAKQYGY